MPSEHALPRGPRRDFVDELFEHFRAARRPPLLKLSEEIAGRDDLAGTASRETIRRMLRGMTVPTNWATVEAVFLVLCDLANRDPNEVLDRRSYDDQETWATRLERLWNEAIDDAEPAPAVASYTDEPPF